MKPIMPRRTALIVCAAAIFVAGANLVSAQDATDSSSMADIRTPPAAPAPNINGADIFGVRPDHPFFYHIPATGNRPMTFSADSLPDGLTLNPDTGDITGTLHKKHTYKVTLHAKNALG